MSRNLPKLYNLTDNIVLGATGCHADVLTLTRLIGARIKMFKYTHNQTIRTRETSQMLANMLYAKRFFPYSVTNILVSSIDSKDLFKYIHYGLKLFFYLPAFNLVKSEIKQSVFFIWGIE